MPTEPGTYIETLKVRLLLDELVQSFEVLREEGICTQKVGLGGIVRN